MKYELDTIPVWDALRADTECALCLLERRSRTNALRYFLGPAVMVPEVRVQTNERGFAPHNLRLLSKDANKLGLALLTHTRLKGLRAKLAVQAKPAAGEAARLAAKTGPMAALANKSGLRDKVAGLANFIRQQEMHCLIDEKVSDDLARYAFTLVALWKDDGEFLKAWQTGKGLCLHHAPGVLDMAAEQLDGPRLGAFLIGFLELQDRNLARVEHDVLSFTQTFDSTHSHEITGRTEGALDRALQKTAGEFPEYVEEAKSRRGPLMGSQSGG
ncbi:MAG: DUF6062 family protein [Spirochaetales bacterium]